MGDLLGIMAARDTVVSMAMTEQSQNIRLTPTQLRTFDELLSIGTERPTMPIGLVEELTDKIVSGTQGILSRWTETRLFMSKSGLGTVLRCEGQLIAERSAPPSQGMHAPTAVGIVTHRAISISHTHPGRAVADYVEASLRSSMQDDTFREYWDSCDMGTQSDLLGQMVSKTTLWLDSFPPLSPSWTPRFEEGIQAKLGKLILSARPDFTLGRPRPDGRQTMLLADLKTGGLNDTHFDEAMFYALVATLRFGSAPYRSVVYSLASGDWTEPDVTRSRLLESAERVVMAVRSMVEIMTDVREPLLNAGRWCSWCPASNSCPAAIEMRENPSA